MSSGDDSKSENYSVPWRTSSPEGNEVGIEFAPSLPWGGVSRSVGRICPATYLGPKVWAHTDTIILVRGPSRWDRLGAEVIKNGAVWVNTCEG